MPAPIRLTVREALVAAPAHAELWLTLDEMVSAVGLSVEQLERLVQRGLVESADADGRRFSAAAAARLRRMLRLRRDLGVSLEGAAIIADLVERLEEMDRELTRLRAR